MTIEYYQPFLSRSVLRQFGLSMVAREPKSLLSPVIHSFIQISAQSSSPYPLVPSGLSALFCSSGGALLTSSTSRPMAFRLPAAGEYFGVVFRPGALRQYIQSPMAVLHNQAVNIKSLSSPLFEGLVAQLSNAKSFERRVSLCERAFERQGVGRLPKALTSSLEVITRENGLINLESDLAKRIGISVRQINRLCSDYLGMNTKKFAQVVRLQRVCEFLQADPSNSLRAAHEFGYVDQSHLLKDFKNHLSESPTHFFKRFTSDFYNTSR